ncbi:ABC transporter substrate-binding protein [Photobacterium nomapromontoriensis]|uniref:ABC transporter substrate-binding protein n=1 Tax=Photobacterium nomapromontoriensis TaxID=2910237 RepID=UPI003D12076E
MIRCIDRLLFRPANHALMVVLFIFSSFGYTATDDHHKRTILTIVPEYKDAISANFNPYSRSSMPTTHEFIFEPLIIFNTLQNNLPEYRLATHYQLDLDLKGISFILRKDVHWSDGTLFTADDVLFSFAIIQRHPELDSQGINQWVKKIEKRSNHEVYFTLKKPNALIANVLVMHPIVPKHQWKTVTDFSAFENAKPIGTGPFTEISELDDNGYLQCANPRYWQADKRHIDCLRYPRVSNNDDFIARIATGEFDWSGSFIPDIERHYASLSPDFKYWLPPASNISLMFNFKATDPEIQALFNHIDFRRAISMSVQRQLLIDIAAFGQGEPSRYASGISERFKQWIDPVSTEKYLPYMTFNPLLAASMLDKLGIIDHTGDGWRDRPSGDALELSLLTPNGWSDFNTTALLISEMMGRIGIKVNTEQTDFNQFIEQLSLGDYQLALTNYPQGPTPFRYFDAAFNSTYQATQYPRYAMHFYKDAQIDSLLAQFPVAANPDQRLSIIQKLNQLIASKQITVPLYNTVQFYQYNTQRFEGWFSKENPVASPLAWPQAPERLLHVLALKPIQHTAVALDNVDK